MASYISSNANRFYAALESAYGSVAAIAASNRIPALKLTVQQQLEVTNRKDKTGSRTFPGLPAGGRRRTNFELQTYMTSWQSAAGGPAYGPLFQAALGAAPLVFNGGMVASCSNTTLAFAAPHGLNVSQAVSSGGEIRFVTVIVDANTVEINAPFTAAPASGTTIGAAVTYQPATELPSASVFDYWDPASAVQRILSGAAVDQMEIQIDGDFHEFHFSGMAQDVLDSASFTAGQGNLTSYPAEPGIGAFDYSIVPGNLGEAWLGTTPAQFFTVTEAAVVLKNGWTRGRGNLVSAFRKRSHRDKEPCRRRSDFTARPTAQHQRCTGGAAADADQRDVPTRPDAGPGDGRVPAERNPRGSAI